MRRGRRATGRPRAGLAARASLVLAAALAAAAMAPPAVTAERALAAALAGALQAPVVQCAAVHLDGRRLAAYYPLAEPLWLDDRGAPLRRAERLRAALAGAGRDGLPPERYRLDPIGALWAATAPADRACLELLLTDGYDRYSRELRSGRTGPLEADPSWTLRPEPFDPAAALHAAGSDAQFAALLDSLAPPHPGYRAARAALARYRALAADGGWRPLPPGPALAPGDIHEQVPLLRARLRREGDLAWLALSFGRQYDDLLAEAVRRYQGRHGLSPDAIVGARTRAALEVPAGERVAQLERVLERWRWLPRALGERHVLVNTAGFELTVVDRARTRLSMRVIVGTPEQPTPSFAAGIEAVVINPYWYVPPRIARERLVPRARQQPDYLAMHGFRLFEVSDGEWRERDPDALDPAQLESGRQRLRQEPGPLNALGRLAFVPPNPFDVVLHDTPERALFDREPRRFSEGCVRVEQPLALAAELLRADPAWSAERIGAEIETLRHRVLVLPEPVPLYVLYLPAWVDDDGRVQFREDHYRREAVLAEYFPAR